MTDQVSIVCVLSECRIKEYYMDYKMCLQQSSIKSQIIFNATVLTKNRPMVIALTPSSVM